MRTLEHKREHKWLLAWPQIQLNESILSVTRKKLGYDFSTVSNFVKSIKLMKNVYQKLTHW